MFGLSASVLLGNGINATFAYSDRDNDDVSPDQDAWTFKLGYKLGQHAFTADYGLAKEATMKQILSASPTQRNSAKPLRALQPIETLILISITQNR